MNKERGVANNNVTTFVVNNKKSKKNKKVLMNIKIICHFLTVL